MPPKDYDLLRPVYGSSSVYGIIQNVETGYRYDPVDSFATSLNMVIGNLDQYSEDEILETLPKIERLIDDLPIPEYDKIVLSNVLWEPARPVKNSLDVIVKILTHKN